MVCCLEAWRESRRHFRSWFTSASTCNMVVFETTGPLLVIDRITAPKILGVPKWDPNLGNSSYDLL